MDIVKSVIKAVWPIIYKVLEKQVDKTETKFDDISLEAANAAIQEFLDDTESDVEFK